MTDMNVDLPALIGSRICHDLVSPIGAIGNGVELLSMAGGNSQELALISESVDSASARIRFFRLAFGAASPGEMVTARDIQKITEASSVDGRVTFRWPADEAMRRDVVKLVFLLMLCAETALPRGGRVSVVRRTPHTCVEAEGAEIRFAPDLWAPLMQSADGPDAPVAWPEYTAANVQFLLAPLAARDMQVPVAVDQCAARLAVRF